MFSSFARRLAATSLRTSVRRVSAARGAARTFTARAAPAGVTANKFTQALAALGVGVTGSAMYYAYNQYQRPALAAAVPYTGVPGTNNERTFIAVKPDGVQRAIVGEVIRRFEARGYKLVAIKMVHPTLAKAKEHYIDLAKKPFYNGLCKYFSSGPIVCMVWEGQDVIRGGRSLVGATNPRESLPGSIRGDLCVDVGRNIIHGSDGPDSAQAEIALWFNVRSYLRRLVENVILMYAQDSEVTSWSKTDEQWVHS